MFPELKTTYFHAAISSRTMNHQNHSRRHNRDIGSFSLLHLTYCLWEVISEKPFKGQILVKIVSPYAILKHNHQSPEPQHFSKHNVMLQEIMSCVK